MKTKLGIATPFKALSCVANKPNGKANLYMIVYGIKSGGGKIFYGWADSEENAFKKYARRRFEKHTIIKIDPDNLPVEIRETTVI